MRFWVINGPNLNWLGRREVAVYGDLSLEAVNDKLMDWAAGRKLELVFRQANCEGRIIDFLQAAEDDARGVVLNPGAFGHYSLAIADAVSALTVPVVEVHLTNVFAREPERHTLPVAARCHGLIAGLGWRGYRLALETLTEIIEGSE
ncbi:MAG: 3-dehydroquinate dehydratase [Firmicutes bacterium]|nr:3-dehydroquinate dehydratase [Bacillota bacterium]